MPSFCLQCVRTATLIRTCSLALPLTAHHGFRGTCGTTTCCLSCRCLAFLQTQPLQELVLSIHRMFDRAVIVGDDYVFDSVRAAVDGLKRRHGYVARTLSKSYIILPKRGPFASREFERTLDAMIDRHGAIHRRVKVLLLPYTPTRSCSLLDCNLVHTP